VGRFALYAPHFVQGVTASHGLWIDTRTGKRFVNELADRKTRADAILAAGNKCIASADAEGYAKGTTGRPTDNLDKMKEAGVLMEYASLEEMAAAHDIPLEPLQATVDAFNAGIDAGVDGEWGRYLADDIAKIGTAPYYVVRLSPKIHHTMGGCATNTRAEALDVVSGDPIQVLFVVGEAAGGIHGASRLGSCAYTDCLTFGRIAGQNAAALESWN
jgi:succinate dehydrogenase/fumarate reductase flavoprotein subunit